MRGSTYGAGMTDVLTEIARALQSKPAGPIAYDQALLAQQVADLVRRNLIQARHVEQLMRDVEHYKRLAYLGGEYEG